MAKGGFREEVLNVVLAQLLGDHGVISTPEQIISSTAHAARKMPDVLVVFQGLGTVIEGKVEGPGAEDAVLAPSN